MSPQLVFIAYALFLFLGAYFGWKAKSKVSLIMASCSGVLVLIGVALLRVNYTLGLMLLTAVGVILSVVFLIRLIKTKKVMPSGMLLFVTVLYLIICILELWKTI